MRLLAHKRSQRRRSANQQRPYGRGLRFVASSQVALRSPSSFRAAAAAVCSLGRSCCVTSVLFGAARTCPLRFGRCNTTCTTQQSVHSTSERPFRSRPIIASSFANTHYSHKQSEIEREKENEREIERYTHSQKGLSELIDGRRIDGWMNVLLLHFGLV